MGLDAKHLFFRGFVVVGFRNITLFYVVPYELEETGQLEIDCRNQCSLQPSCCMCAFMIVYVWMLN